MGWVARRWVIRGLGALVLLAAIVFVASGWYFSNEIKSGALDVKHEPDKRELEVMAVQNGQVSLRKASGGSPDGHMLKGGIWGLEWAGGYAQVSDIVSVSADTVVRRFSPITGAPAVGERVRLDSYAFPEDVRRAAANAQEVSFTSELGSFPAWYVEGGKSTWAIFVHGWTADRGEALRLLPGFVKEGYPCLVITYRNDAGVAASPDGLYDWGETEWQEVEGAARYAMERGATRLVLVGYSMGGGSVANFLYRSSLSRVVSGVVLDAPVLNFDATIDYQAGRRSVPGPLAAAGKLFATWRFGVDWKARDYARRAAELKTPVLLFHGDDDERTPIAVSEAFAKRRPDLVRYVRVHGATHVRSWNMDPTAYETAVRQFLGEVAP